ncbi:MAG: DUF5683 domain-containing protein [Candidatus Eiseniibacteriota bacterium]
MAPSFAGGQTAADLQPTHPPEAVRTTILTVFTNPSNADVSIKGPSDLIGRTPIDVPPLMTGIHSITVSGSGLSRTQGVIYLPPAGGLPFVVSEPPGVTPALLLRGLNFPGITQFMGSRAGRGYPFATAAVGAATMAIRGHVMYRDRLDEVGDFAADRARDERYGRNSWLIYSGVVWGLSAMDYWIRPRLSQAETTPARLTLGVPETTRFGALWRSILVPGAGQEYANHRTRSIVWLATVLGSGAAYVVTDYRVRRDETDQFWAQVNADSAGPSTQAQRNQELDQANRSLQASKDIRSGTAITTAVFYGLNLFDALVMYLNLEAPDKTKVSSISPILTPDGPGLAVQVRF